MYETELPRVPKYTLQVIFVFIFIFYYAILHSSSPVYLTYILPIGFLIYLFAIPLGNEFLSLLFAGIIGFIVGWIVQKLWRQGTIGRILLVVILLVNSFGYFYWFFANADLGP